MKALVSVKKLNASVIFLMLNLWLYFPVVFMINATLLGSEIGLFSLSWLGNLVLISYCYIYYKSNHEIFTPFNILALFMALFNWGQCIMWSLGIHTDTEIGTGELYSNYRMPTPSEIMNGQMFTIVMMAFFLCGALFANSVISKKERHRISDAKEMKVLYRFSKYVSFLVVPLTFYRIFQALVISFTHGYAALYYGDYNIAGGWLTQVEYIFFPVLVGLLIGSNYAKSTRRNVYIIFGVYMILYFISGERGNWLYKLILLIWLEHKFYRPINAKIIAKWSVFIILGLYLVYGMIELRNTSLSSVTFDEMLDVVSLEKFPLVSAFFDMGGNMSIIIILLIEGSDIWNNYNTYLAAIIGMPATFWLEDFGIKFTYLENWFSQDFLEILWGSGFSFVGEAFLNGGKYFAFIYVVILGFFISAVTRVDNKIGRNNGIAIAFVVTSCNAFTTMMRGSCHSSFKAWFLGSIIYLSCVILISKSTNFRVKNRSIINK